MLPLHTLVIENVPSSAEQDLTHALEELAVAAPAGLRHVLDQPKHAIELARQKRARTHPVSLPPEQCSVNLAERMWSNNDLVRTLRHTTLLTSTKLASNSRDRDPATHVDLGKTLQDRGFLVGT
jgi:hypothetical protein